jgi:hypothetical protein
VAFSRHICFSIESFSSHRGASTFHFCLSLWILSFHFCFDTSLLSSHFRFIIVAGRVQDETNHPSPPALLLGHETLDDWAMLVAKRFLGVMGVWTHRRDRIPREAEAMVRIHHVTLSATVTLLTLVVTGIGHRVSLAAWLIRAGKPSLRRPGLRQVSPDWQLAASHTRSRCSRGHRKPGIPGAPSRRAPHRPPTSTRCCPSDAYRQPHGRNESAR